MKSLAAAHAAGRLPHALLIHEAPGTGGEWLARWMTQLVLCRQSPAPCGKCIDCARAAAGQHPDLLLVQPTEESAQLRIEQVRELAQELALTSHGGGYKVGILSPVDAMNRFAGNALLKTLEEPPPKTVLILVAIEPSRLPATILSRCQKIRIGAPSRAASLAWLRESKGQGDWEGVLGVLGEAPMLAAEADAEAIPRLARETETTLAELYRGAADPVATADRWSRSELPLRLRCFENWLTNHIRTEIRGTTHLSPRGSPAKLRGLFETLDGVREMRATLDAPLNKSLALEGLFRRVAPAEKRQA